MYWYTNNVNTIIIIMSQTYNAIRHLQTVDGNMDELNC